MMLIPKFQPIIYERSWLESLKWAFLQYVAVLIPFYYIIFEKLLKTAFDRNILKALVTSELI
jgi:hypothetical protein